MNAKITFVELAELMADANSTSRRVCELFLRELFATVSQALIDGEQVKINGVGTFKVTEVKARKSVNVSTGKAIEIGGHKKLTFTPIKSLADAVNQPFAQFETVFLDDAVTDEKLAEIDKQYPSLFQEVADQEEEVQPSVSASEDKDAPFAPLPENLPEMSEPAPVPEPVHEPETELELTPEPEEQVAPEPEEQTILADNSEEETEVAGKEDEPKKEEPQAQATDTPQSRPMLVGIPIDGPSQPVPESEPVFEPDPNEYFYRPEPRNTYTPTPEQLAATPRHRDMRWLWAVLAVAVVGLLIWLFARGGQADAPQEEHVAVQADTVVAEPKEITDTVTAQIVLTTLSERYYDSPWFWVYIYEENKSIINNPNNIKPGTVVVIPPAEKYGIDAKDPASLKKAQIRSMELLKRW